MKTRISGAFKDYSKMFEQIKDWNNSDADGVLYGLGWAIDDIGYHGWTGEAAENEHNIFKKVETAHSYLLKTLAEAIGYEYPEDSSEWKYYLKDIDTDKLLDL